MLKYSQRLLSISGKGLVDNSLLLKRSLHCLRTTVVPFRFYKHYNPISSVFCLTVLFLFVIHEVCQWLRKQGVTAVLNQSTQLCALQLCWLLSVLVPQTLSTDGGSFPLPVLHYCLCSYSNTVDLIMHLVFDNLQSPDVMTLGFFRPLFRTVDMLDYLIIWDELTLLWPWSYLFQRLFLTYSLRITKIGTSIGTNYA